MNNLFVHIKRPKSTDNEVVPVFFSWLKNLVMGPNWVIILEELIQFGDIGELVEKQKTLLVDMTYMGD